MVNRIVLIGCIDFRLNRRIDGRDYIGEFIARLGCDCFPVTRAGGVQDLIRPLSEGFKDSILRDIRVGVKGHGADEIIAVNHQNCAAYAHFGFKNPKEEYERHCADLIEASKLLFAEFPGIVASLYYAELRPGTRDEFSIKPFYP